MDGKTGSIARVTDEVGQPNGMCFSPDYKKLYVADTGMGTSRCGTSMDRRSGRERVFATLTVPGTKNPVAADGMRCDVDGNLWCGAGSGVQILSPAGEAIGMIRLPEVCANVCFGGARRNRLFMTASQSLYAVYVETTGAHIA